MGNLRRRLLVGSLLLLVFLLSAAPAAAAGRLRVYYAGPAGPVRQALELAAFDLVDAPAQADVFVLNGTVPDPAGLAAAVRAGRGLVLVLGPAVTAADAAVLLDRPAGLQALTTTTSIDQAAGVEDALVREILWNSAPQVRERAPLQGVTLEPLVEGYGTAELILGRTQVGHGAVYLLTPYLDAANNPQIQQWSYFNYLVYHLVARAAHTAPLSFADYPASPVPHARERDILLLLLWLVLLGAVLAFVLVRRYSKAHPEALDALVADREKYAAREAGTDWEEVGFHRPLGGFLLALMMGLFLFIPLIVYQNLILPVYILPSAQALGLWGRVTQFFQVAWWFFDMGTSAAFIKYLSEYRVSDPRKGIMYGQLFVWWQALSGAVQVGLVVALASTLVPRSAYAIYAWSIVIHTFIQLPGFYQIVRHAMTGLQRFDYAQVQDLALNVLLPIVTQPLIVLAMYAWGQANPAFGAATGGLLGLGIAAYAGELLAFLLGLWLYRRLGYGVKVLFLAHFDWETIRSSFRFGVWKGRPAVSFTEMEYDACGTVDLVAARAGLKVQESDGSDR